MSKKLKIKIEDIYKLYLEGKNFSEIAEILNCTTSNVIRRLKKIGVNTKRDYTKTRYNRINRHKINLNFFENITTEK